MTVYVDNMRAPLGPHLMCHMLADSDPELHAMAARIGMERRRHQKPGAGSHYDISQSRRALAVALGAVEISWKQASAMVLRRRITGALGQPEDAVAWAHAHFARRRAERAPS